MDSDPAPTPSLLGLWMAEPASLPPRVARERFVRLERAPVAARGLRFQEEEDRITWCLHDVREPDPPSLASAPCACTRDGSADCVGGTLLLEDPLVPGGLAALTMSHDDARSDLVGVATLIAAAEGDTLGLHVVSVREDPLRRPRVATGLQGPVWAGADELGWYRRVVESTASTP
ncbi:MAG: hypothetical protein H6732_10070 [Alphaproteobacteria bacterium]|nr:hypothetical protein [Alphaproteobacteria bacterium]